MPQPLLVISPMAGVTDLPFRSIALRYGADYGISEMLISQTRLWGSQKSMHRLKGITQDSPAIVQIAGASPEVITEAIHACEGLGVKAIEINMGCPAKKVCKVLAGSALLRDETLVASILSAAVNATLIPIYLKTRLGWDHSNKNILTIAKIAQECGVKSLAIHGRTRSDLYNGTAAFDLIAEVKQRSKIPVFANGDINTPEQASDILQYTKADGLYIGRGALGKPWLFQQIKSFLATGAYEKLLNPVTLINLIIEHIQLIYQHYGDELGVRIARKHFKWYLTQNADLFASQLLSFAEFSQLTTAQAQLKFLLNIF